MENENIGFGEATPDPSQMRGHRSRLKARFMKNGASALAEYELLELVLFRSIPRRDTKPLAKQLINVFGSFAEVLAAPQERLQEIKGLGQSTITDFQIVKASAEALVSGEVREKAPAWILVICHRLLPCSNGIRGQRAVQQVGTVDHTPVYPREVVKRALELSATAIILIHNHPSGDPTPSQADIEMTKTINEIASSLGITVHDHIIIAKDGHASLKGLKLF
ncbi:hypothetical protein GQR58_005309 [Nymphon striatum]|nr:hypothetical protein GQR58_005309 [Nymphon striatum]